MNSRLNNDSRSSKLQRLVDKLVGERELLLKQRERIDRKKVEVTSHLEKLSEITSLLTLSLSIGRQGITGRIKELATRSLRTIYDDTTLDVEIVQSKRGESPSVEFLVSQDGNTLDPLIEMGGGVVDVLSLVLRLIVIEIMNLQGPLMLDEPFKFLSADYVRRASEFLHEYSQEMDRQVILITQSPDYIGDKIFDVSKRGSITKISAA